MSGVEISSHTPGDLLAQLALSIHRVTGGLPIALKSRHQPGVFVDRDGAAELGYESEALDSVFVAGETKKVRVDGGRYAGVPMIVSPIEDRDGYAVAALGVVDALGTLSLQEFAEISERIRQQIINSR